MRIGLALLAAIPVLLSACAEPEDSAERASVIGEPLQQSLERAEGVEATVLQQAEDTRRRIEEAEGR